MESFSSNLPAEELSNLIEGVAQKVSARGLETPAILFLEMHKPLFGVLQIIGLCSAPIIYALFGKEWNLRIAKVLESPEYVEQLIKSIERAALEMHSGTRGTHAGS